MSKLTVYNSAKPVSKMIKSIYRHILLGIPQIDSLFIWVLVVFMAAPLRLYAPTSFIVEVLCFLFFLYYTVFKGYRGIDVSRNVSNSFFFLAFLMVLFFVIGAFISDYDDFCFKENYRFFVQFLFVAIIYYYPLNYERILEVALFLCKLHILFTIYELIYLNLVAFDDVNGLFITGKAMALYSEDSQYMNPSNDIGIYYIRPFGLMLQPQKSAFVYSFGILIKYLLNRLHSSKEGEYWYFIFLIATIAVSGKTAIVCSFLFLLAIKFKIYPSFYENGKRFIYLLLGGFVLTSIYYVFVKNVEAGISSSTAGNDITNDFKMIFNYPWYEALLGHGIPSVIDLQKHGFIVESYLARVVLQMGYIPFLIVIPTACFIYRSRTKMLNYLMVVLLFTIICHYCVLNTPFFQFLIAVIISFYKKNQI